MIYHLIGLSLIMIGFSHKMEPAQQVDRGVVKFLQYKLGRSPFLVWFEEIWFLGRTAFTMTILLLLTGYNWKLGLLAFAVFAVAAGLEKFLKITFNRSRPFSVHQDIQMLQPRKPVDPSFPSGDALRIWFLVLLLSVVLGNNLLFGIISTLLAVLVSLGRMIFGVHYLTDVLAGAGLGFLTAGTTIWLGQIFQIL